MKTLIYTDGACSGNPGPGGLGVVIIKNQEISTFSGNESSTTNNRMELTAAIKGIDKSSKDTGKPLEMTIFTDSNYLRQGITEWIISWKKNKWVNSSKKPVANKDLWIILDSFNSYHKIEWRWVKAHQNDTSSDTIYNNMADKLATEAINK